MDLGRLGVSVVPLSLARVVIPGSWDRFPCWGPCSGGSPLLPLPLPALGGAKAGGVEEGEAGSLPSRKPDVVLDLGLGPELKADA